MRSFLFLRLVNKAWIFLDGKEAFIFGRLSSSVFVKDSAPCNHPKHGPDAQILTIELLLGVWVGMSEGTAMVVIQKVYKKGLVSFRGHSKQTRPLYALQNDSIRPILHPSWTTKML